MSACWCSLAGTSACRSCSNNPYADHPPTIRTNTIVVTDKTFYTYQQEKIKDDTISRLAAVDALKVAYWDNEIQSAKDDPCIVDAMTDWAIRQVKALPSAQQKPLKYSGNSICVYCKTADCIGCAYEPMTDERSYE